MNQVAEDKLSVISNEAEQRCVILSIFLFSPFYSCLTTMMIASVYHQRTQLMATATQAQAQANTHMRGHLKAVNYALLSMISSVFCYSMMLLLANNFVFPWDFSALDYEFSTVGDTLINCSWGISKVAFYSSFAYQSMALLDKNKSNFQNKELFRRLVWAGNTIFLVCAFGSAIDDAAQHHMKEIGTFPDSDFYFSEWMSHKGATVNSYFAVILTVIDMLYFVFLLYVYCKKLNDKPFVTVQGCILLGFACVVLWINMIGMLLQFRVRWILGSTDLFSDDLALYLLFAFNNAFYIKVCGCCHRSVTCVCFNEQANEFELVAGTNQSDEEAEAEVDEDDGEQV